MEWPLFVTQLVVAFGLLTANTGIQAASVPSTSSTTEESTDSSNTLRRLSFGMNYDYSLINRLGENDTYGQFPWQVSLIKNYGVCGARHCGAVLISENWVLTSAHCITDVRDNWDSTYLRFGFYSGAISETNLHRTVIKTVVNYKIHPNFKPYAITKGNDLALLKFDSSMQFDESNFVPVSIQKDQNTYEGQKVWVTGWGNVHDASSNVLLAAQATVNNKNDCDRSIWFTKLPADCMCAGDETTESRYKRGEAGDAVFVKQGDKWILIGILFLDAGGNISPSVYTSISKHREWIETTIGINHSIWPNPIDWPPQIYWTHPEDWSMEHH